MTPSSTSKTTSQLPVIPYKTKHPTVATKDKNGGLLKQGFHSEAGLTVSEATYWEKYYKHGDFNYEWNNGILEEKPVSNYNNTLLYLWYLDLLNAYLYANPIAKVVVMDMGFRLALPHKVSIRKPDVAVILNNNTTKIEGEDRSYKGIYDICIEILSDSSKQDVERDTVDKKMEYAAGGVKEYYILHQEGEHMAFYTLNHNGLYIPIQPTNNGIIQSSVLPGFQFREKDLYRHPTLKEMSADKVYHHFVWLDYQQEKERADREAQRAEQEAQRANNAEKKLRYEQQQTQELLQMKEEKIIYLTSQLKALGKTVDEE